MRGLNATAERARFDGVIVENVLLHLRDLHDGLALFAIVIVARALRLMQDPCAEREGLTAQIADEVEGGVERS